MSTRAAQAAAKCSVTATKLAANLREIRAKPEASVARILSLAEKVHQLHVDAISPAERQAALASIWAAYAVVSDLASSSTYDAEWDSHMVAVGGLEELVQLDEAEADNSLPY
jgi:hypothetical protein